VNPHGSGLGRDHQSVAGSADQPGIMNAALTPLAKLGNVGENKNPCNFTSHAGGMQWNWKRVFPQAASDAPVKGDECLALLPSTRRKYVGDYRCYCCGERGAEVGEIRYMLHYHCSKQQTNKH